MSRVIVDVENIDKAIQYSMDVEYKIRPMNLQFNIASSNIKKDSVSLVKLCEKLTNYKIDIQALGGKVKSYHREAIDMSLESAIEQLSISNHHIHTSLKTYHKPLSNIHEYQKDSYIELCSRFRASKNYEDIFIWIYIDIEHLEQILKQFVNKLEYYEY